MKIVKLLYLAAVAVAAVSISTPQPRRLASPNIAAEYAGVCTRTIRRHIAAGRLTGYRLGPRLVRVDLNELDAMLRPIPTAGVDRHGPDAA